MSSDTLLVEIAELRERCEFLEAENEWLRSQIHPGNEESLVALAEELHLQHWCLPALDLIINQPMVSRESINELHETISGSEHTAMKHHCVAICHIRRGLGPLGLHIETIRGWGYRMPKKDREVLKSMLDQAIH